MKYLLYIFLTLSFFYGCSPSIIKIKPGSDTATYPMYGENSGRNFYTSWNIGDTLIKKWENDVNGGFAYSSVTAYGNYIFASDLSGRVFCFDNNTGKTVGKLRYKGAVFSAPIIDKTKIFFAVAPENDNESDLISYNFILGKEFFDVKIKGKILTEIVKADSSLIFSTEDGKIFKYTLYGEKKWEFDCKVFTHSSPAVNNGIVFLGNDKGEILAVDFNNGKLIYRKKIEDALPFYSGAAIRNRMAVIGNDNGKLYAIDIKTGRISWKFDTSARITMIPAIRKGIIVVGNLNGDIYGIVKLNGRLLWKIKTGGLLNATPLIANNTIILPDYNRKIYLMNIRSGQIIKTYKIEGRVKLSPVIADSTLFIGYENGNICAYKF